MTAILHPVNPCAVATLPPGSRRSVLTALIDCMGRWGTVDDSGRFSPVAFFAKYQSMDAGAKAALAALMLDGKRTTVRLEKIAAVIGKAIDGRRHRASAALLILGSDALANAGAALLANPRVVAWLAECAKVNASKMPEQLAKMRAFLEAEGDPEQRALMAEFLDDVAQELER